MTAQYISEKALAKRWGVSHRTIQIWRQQKDYFLPFIRFGKHVRYSIDDIETHETTLKQSICGERR